METKLPVSIGFVNTYNIKVFDETTGELKQEVNTHNIVVKEIERSYKQINGVGPAFLKMHLGTGAGTPSYNNISMFGNISNVDITEATRTFAYPTSTAVYKATFPASTTEVGVVTNIGLSRNGPTALTAHALLYDAEGNIITINKSSTDVFVVTVTVNMTLNLPSFVKPVRAEQNAFFTQTLGPGSTYSNTYGALYIVCGKYQYNDADCYVVWWLNEGEEFTGTIPNYMNGPNCVVTIDDAGVSYASFTETINDSAMSVTMTYRITAANSNIGTLRGIYLRGFGIILFNSDTFTPVELHALTVGTGDGIKTNWPSPIRGYIEGTEKVYINDQLVTAGYTVSPNDNTRCRPYASACNKLKAIYPNKTSSNYWGYKYHINTGGAIHTKGYIESIIAFNTATTVSKLCFKRMFDVSSNIPGSYKVVLEYSNDMTTWVEATRTPDLVVAGTEVVTINSSKSTYQVRNLPDGATYISFAPITAKYWRMYLLGPSDSINYYIAQAYNDAESYLFLDHWTGNGITFATPPAVGDTIKFAASVAAPFKTSDYVVDFALGLQVSVTANG